MKRFAGGLSLVAALLLAASIPALAQEEQTSSPGLLTVHYDRVEPSKVGEFEANTKQWVEAFKAAGMGPEWSWYGYSGPDFTYAWVSAMPDWAYLDGQEAREKELVGKIGEEKFKELIKGMDFIRSHHSEVLKPMPEVSYAPAESGSQNPTFAHVGIHHVKPAMEDRYQALLERVKAAFEKAQAPLGYNAYKVQFGQGSWLFVTLADDAAQFYSQADTGKVLEKAEGAEAMQEMFAEWTECVSGFELSDWQIRPDLSFAPGPGTAAEAEDEAEAQDD